MKPVGEQNNRKEIGSYTACCPGEHSSGNAARLGAIDRVGNGRLPALPGEAVLHFLTRQPKWKAAQRMRLKLTGGRFWLLRNLILTRISAMKEETAR